MALINHAELEGNLTDNPQLNHTKKGTSVTTFAMANDRIHYDSQGKKHVHTDYPIVTLWGKSADNLCKYAGKGSLISIEGHNQTRHYKNKQGETVYVQEIVANNMQFLRTKRPQSDSNHDAKQSSSTDKEPSKSINDQVNKLNINDDDLPF